MLENGADYRERIFNSISGIESRMTDKAFKNTLEELFQELLDRLRKRDSGPVLDAFIKTIKKQVASTRLETKISAGFFLHTFLGQIPNKSRSDFHGLLDQVETEVAPAALNALLDLLEDSSHAYAKASEGYKFNLRMLAILSLLTFFNNCQDRFSQGHNGRLRRFDSFTQRLAIPEDVNRGFGQFANLKLNLLENRLNYFEKSEKIEFEEVNQRVEALLEQARVIRERIYKCLTGEATRDNFDRLYEHLEVYEEQLLRLEEAKIGKAKSVSEANRTRIRQEDEYGKFVFEDFFNMVKNEGSDDLPRLQMVLLNAYEEVFSEAGNKSPAIVKSRTIMMPEIKAEKPKNETSEFFEDNSNQLGYTSGGRGGASSPFGNPRFNFSKGRSVMEDTSLEAPKPTGFTNMFDKPKAVISSKARPPLDSIAESESNAYLSQTPAAKLDRASIVSVEPRKIVTEKKVTPFSVDVPRKSTRRFEEAFADVAEEVGLRDSQFNRSSFNNGGKGRLIKDSRILNISGIERKSVSSLMEGKSIVKLNFGGLKASGKLESMASDDRKNIVGEALSKVSTLMNQKKGFANPIKPVSSQSNLPPQPAPVPVAGIPVPNISQFQMEVPAEVPPVRGTTILESALVGPTFSAAKGGTAATKQPFTPVYEDKIELLTGNSGPGRSEIRAQGAPQAKGGSEEPKEVFDFNDFHSADSEKLETPPEQSIRDHSNIIPASLKGSIGRSASINTNLRLMNDFNVDFVPESDGNPRTAISKKTGDPKQLHSDTKTTPIDQTQSNSTAFHLADRENNLAFDDPNYSAINQRLGGSRENSKNDDSDNYSQLAIDEKIINDKKALEQHILEQKQAFQALVQRTQQTRATSAVLGSSELEKDLEVYKNFVKTLTADYDRLLTNNRLEMKEFQQNIEAMAAQNEKYKHKIFKIENEVIALREERTRLKSHFASQKAKYEDNISRQREALLKTTNDKIRAMEKLMAEKMRTASLGSAGELTRIQNRNAELELAVNDLKLEVETIKNQKLNDLYELKEKIGALKEVAQGVKGDYSTLSSRVLTLLDSRRLKDNKDSLMGVLTAQAELSEKLKMEQKRNEELRRQLVTGQTESNLIRSDLTFTHRVVGARPTLTSNVPAKIQIANLRESLQKFELWAGVALQGLSSQIIGLVRRNRNKVSRRLVALDTQNSHQMKELTKLKFQSDLAVQDYNHLKEKNHQLADEIQALKRELVDSKKNDRGAKATQFDTEMMRKHRQLQHEKDSLLELNKLVNEQNLQLKEKLALAETEFNCTEKIMSVVRKLEQENEELMSVNKALFNEVIHLKSVDRPNESSREQLNGLKRENEQLRQITHQLAKRPPSKKESMDLHSTISPRLTQFDRDKALAKGSVISGTGFMKKISVLMDHLSTPQPEEATATIVDWLEENVASSPSLMAQICVNPRYNLIKMEALRVTVSEQVAVGSSNVGLALTFTFANLTNASIAVESFQVACDHKSVAAKPLKSMNFSVNAFDEGVLTVNLDLEPQYLLKMTPIYVNFSLLGKRFSREPGSRGGYFSLPLPLTINKLVSYQQEDITKFPLIRTLQKVGEMNVECPRGASPEVITQVFPEMADVSGNGTAFWVKVSSFFGMFFMTIVVDEPNSFNVKLFAMFESPLHPVFLRTVCFILSSI